MQYVTDKHYLLIFICRKVPAGLNDILIEDYTLLVIRFFYLLTIQVFDHDEELDRTKTSMSNSLRVNMYSKYEGHQLLFYNQLPASRQILFS